MRTDISPQAKPRPRVEQLNALTSLRFFAAAHVLLFHYQLMFFYNHFKIFPPAAIWLGFTSVTFFFVLSGFILAHNYASVRFDVTALRRYAVARLSRIYPVYLLSLLVAAPFFLKQFGAQPDWLRPLWLSGGVLAPLGLHAWVPGAACALNCPSWSISTEFFFYLMFPLLLPLAARRPLAFAAVTAALWLSAALFYIWLWRRFGDGGSIVLGGEGRGQAASLAAQLIMYFPIGRLPEFMIGITAYMFWSRYRDRIPASAALAVFAILATLIVSFHTMIPEIIVHNGGTSIAWVALIIAAANMRGGILNHRAAVFLGQSSYGLYLLHGPIALAVFSADTLFLGRALRGWPWTTATLTAALAILVSCLVFRLFEEPCRRALRRRFTHGRTAVPGQAPVAGA
jgi:peptidoglycan/LPS O-acetylase OafA/YrhL